MTQDTIDFLLLLINQQMLPVGAPDFEELVEKVVRAKAELSALSEAHDA